MEFPVFHFVPITSCPFYWTPLKEVFSLPHQVFIQISKIFLSLLFSKLNSSSCSSSWPYKYHLHYPLRDLLLYIQLVLGNPELDAVLQMWPHQHWVEEKYHTTAPTGNDKPNAVQRLLTFFPTRLPWWLTVNFMFSRNQMPFCAVLISNREATSFFWWMVYSSLCARPGTISDCLPIGLCNTDHSPFISEA